MSASEFINKYIYIYILMICSAYVQSYFFMWTFGTITENIS